MPAKRIDIDTAALIKRYKNGESSEKIGAELGISPNTVLYRLRKAGIKRRVSGPPRQMDDETICAMYQAGFPIREIQEKTGVWNIGTFYDVLRRNGIPVRLQRHRLDDPEVKKEVIELRGQGLSHQAIAKKMGINRNYIGKILREKITLPRKVWQEKITLQRGMSIKEMHAAGAMIDEIADIKGISRVEVYKIVGG